MKLNCLNLHLKEALTLSEKIAGKNINLPILDAVLISAQNDKVVISATNLEHALEIQIPAKVKKEGKKAVPARVLSSLLSGLTEDNIELESQGDNLVVAVKNISSIIKGYPTDDFPIFPSIQKKYAFSLPSFDLIEGLKSVLHAVSLSDIKPEISSIFVSSEKNQPLIFAATDSFRLAERSLPGKDSIFPRLLIPQRGAAEIIRIFDGKDANIDFYADKNQLLLICGNIKFFSRLTEGSFPDYQQVVPSDFSTEILLDKDVFKNALRTAGVFSSRLNEVKIRAYPDDRLLEIETSNAELGEHTNHLPAEIKGESIESVFNHRYLLDGLQFIDSKKVALKFNGPEKPLLVKGEKDGYYYLVMPMKNI
ncbi:MAG: polymerase III subunit beta protein [Parcubacteria group bacterium GW2011_GWB1_41_6]|nr:MAG: polymerase III subunit beta protein [Parcubacteria group bacterium GW2011_GWB1_41_6]KKS33568.1 MAG: polymerase III subunit beta protein [Parcubacteria group bacterium GW2011_GWC2_42_13]KKS57851.1 MAG: polymerase III subunit beta protein [Parcubacteria group bacterium GW2011_GWA2_42_35]KKS72216.1 MAG: polymerase III subunit beta protein [Parcubacteria group bacterium GW2011_GWF2_42_7]